MNIQKITLFLVLSLALQPAFIFSAQAARYASDDTLSPRSSCNNCQRLQQQVDELTQLLQVLQTKMTEERKSLEISNENLAKMTQPLMRRELALTKSALEKTKTFAQRAVPMAILTGFVIGWATKHYSTP